MRRRFEVLFYMHPWCALAQSSTVSIQGNRQIIRDVGGVCVDSNPPLWFARWHMLARFANTLDLQCQMCPWR
jgi:hypothetical protein